MVHEHHQGVHGYVIYEPGPGELRILLDLADDPKHDVRSTSDTPQLGVVISEELYQRLLQYKSLSESPSREKPGRKKATP